MLLAMYVPFGQVFYFMHFIQVIFEKFFYFTLLSSLHSMNK